MQKNDKKDLAFSAMHCLRASLHCLIFTSAAMYTIIAFQEWTFNIFNSVRTFHFVTKQLSKWKQIVGANWETPTIFPMVNFQISFRWHLHFNRLPLFSEVLKQSGKVPK